MQHHIDGRYFVYNSRGEGGVVQGHGADGQLLVAVEDGEAVLRDGEARVGALIQQVEERPCTGEHVSSEPLVIPLPHYDHIKTKSDTSTVRIL